MKKIYLKPVIESTIINAKWAVCNPPTVTGEDSQPGAQYEPSGPPTGAPKRRVF